jgi:hypothetical protein
MVLIFFRVIGPILATKMIFHVMSFLFLEEISNSCVMVLLPGFKNLRPNLLSINSNNLTISLSFQLPLALLHAYLHPKV